MCYNMHAFVGNQGSGYQTGNLYQYLVIDGTDSDPAGQGAFFDGGYEIAYSVMNNLSQNVFNYMHSFHDNLVMNWVDPGDGVDHGNVWEDIQEPAGTVNTVYNNLFAHLYKTGVIGVCFWPEPPTTSTLYIFNNIWWDANCGGNYINIGQNSGDQGPVYLFNNIAENPQNGAVVDCQAGGYAQPLTSANNHWITDNSTAYSSACAGSTYITDLRMTHAAAASGGYTSSQTFVYSPTTGASPTVGVGTNSQSYCAALTGDAAIACALDTRYSCSYNQSNHTVSCPGRIAVNRPGSAAWDIGAYQYVAPPPPSVTGSLITGKIGN